jgi:hypothetical protein
MGQRVTQRILECQECGVVPEDGDYLWEMCGGYTCKECVDKDEDE